MLTVERQHSLFHQGRKLKFTLPACTTIVLLAVLYHGDRFSRSIIARYWKEPHRFMPERFLGDWPKDAFIPFSQGLSCLSQHSNRDSRHCRRPCLSRETVRAVAVYFTNAANPSWISFRFFETEGIAIMTTLLSRYKIEVKEEPEFASETFEERYARITAFDQAITTR